MNKKVRLVTVTGSRTNTLWHMLNHYQRLVDEIYVVVYEWDNFSTYDSVKEIVSKFPNAKIVLREVKEKYNWEYVTQLYNEVKRIYPDDWWIVSDDDEFHIYSKPLKEIIYDCDKNGWDIVRGGFIDRIGLNGEFNEINDTQNIFEQFPYAGFFRYPMSGACPNKICITKGYVEITAGQHYAKIDGQTTWRWQGWNHPLIAPVEKYSVQVHHFKWDSTCGERIRAVANINQEYAYSEEYRKMYRELAKSKFKIDINNSEFMFEKCGTSSYSLWSKLFKKIISI
ncbi:MAG: hypothetical protein FJ375_00810 [Pelagibacterales bacterium]|nr:hypothetical protein [Pelagibacterales bacterium]